MQAVHLHLCHVCLQAQHEPLRAWRRNFGCHAPSDLIHVGRNHKLFPGGHPAVNHPPITASHGHYRDSGLTAAILQRSWPHIQSMSKQHRLDSSFCAV